jgi:hypothetical protein
MSSLFDPVTPPSQSLDPRILSQFLSGESSAPVSTEPIRRVVFISHSHLHESETKQFLKDFQEVFSAWHVGVSNRDDFIGSTDPEYVMRRIREKHIGSAAVIIVLVGNCTHSRRYVDWEIKASSTEGSTACRTACLHCSWSPTAAWGL